MLEKDQTDDELSIVITREVDVDGIPRFAKKFVNGKLATFSEGIVENQLTEEFAQGDTWLATH